MNGIRVIQPTYALRHHHCGGCGRSIRSGDYMVKMYVPGAGEEFWCVTCAEGVAS